VLGDDSGNCFDEPWAIGAKDGQDEGNVGHRRGVGG
jgi:hypothetical protein